jgi:ABC-type phosphate transport system auxiliary subunit
MSYDFAFGHPIVYEEPKVPELEKTIESLRGDLKHYKSLYKKEEELKLFYMPFQRKYQAQSKIFDDYIAEKKAYTAEKKTLMDKINDLQAENKKLHAMIYD